MEVPSVGRGDSPNRWKSHRLGGVFPPTDEGTIRCRGFSPLTDGRAHPIPTHVRGQTPIKAHVHPPFRGALLASPLQKEKRVFSPPKIQKKKEAFSPKLSLLVLQVSPLGVKVSVLPRFG
ncbi:hypothetical protein Taro_004959 [Colocasia esculenta]|uniref:Uncharacterized protein n=1 Tax=Colocasia esculenta TaxID=4460 RepID=A0A843TJL8_COLES|nr:hypothetical protein [Colocasia esculenta]